MDFSLFGLQFFDQCMVDLQTKAKDELLKVKRIKKIVSSTVWNSNNTFKWRTLVSIFSKFIENSIKPYFVDKRIFIQIIIQNSAQIVKRKVDVIGHGIYFS